MKYKETEIDASTRLKSANELKETEMKKYYADNNLVVITSISNNEYKHLSVSAATRRPSMVELWQAKEDFFNDVEMAMYFMPNTKMPSDNVYHLFEVKSE